MYLDPQHNTGAASADLHAPETNATFVPPAWGSPEFFKLQAYGAWLINESRMLRYLLGPGVTNLANPAADFHFPATARGWLDVVTPAARAEAVLRLAGVDLAGIKAWALEEAAAAQEALA